MRFFQNFWTKFPLLGCLLLCVGFVTAKIPCRLQWTGISIGSSLPKEILQVHQDQMLVARLLLVDDDDLIEKYVLGNYHVQEERVEYLPASVRNSEIFFDDAENSTEVAPSFETLWNPHNCKISWLQKKTGDPFPEYSVQINGTNSNGGGFIGRAWVEDTWYAGYIVDQSSTQIMVPLGGGGEIKYFSDFQILTSFSDGFVLKIENFEFDENSFNPGVGIMGIDLIQNLASVTISQKVFHNKTVVESHTFPIKNTQEVSETCVSSDKNCLFPSFLGRNTNVKMETKFTESVEETKTVTQETIVSIESEVIVPPESSVMVCSVVGFQDNVVAPYTAIGRYEAPGLSSAEILAILRAQNKPGEIDANGNVIILISGVYEGALAMSTKFVAVEATTGLSCAGYYRNLGYRVVDNF